MSDLISQLLASEKAQPPPSEIDARGADLSFRGLDGIRVLRLLGSGLSARGASFRGAYLDEPLLDGATFSSAVLDGSFIFEGALGDTDFTGASLQRVEWLSCLAPSARFDEANLSGSKFDGTIFPGASFRGANLSAASLVGCSLRHCDLTNADLRGADLSETVLEGAILTGVQGLPLQ